MRDSSDKFDKKIEELKIQIESLNREVKDLL